MSPRIVVTGRTPGRAGRWATGAGGLLACLVVLSSAGCARSSHDTARAEVMTRAEQVAHETEPWATDSLSMRGWASNQSVLDRLVAGTGGERLDSSIHDPDAHGVGLLATVEVVMVGVASDGWGSEPTHHNICVRFEVRREATGPREITPEAVGCPRRIPATQAPR
ncbi:hypothetical protein [Micromonospora sp. NPDC047074]|uniref:hypothetical protein n=1 Tax=Micromonospora sp. NPDC047074 TaxID=3154339 RepID=UPI0033F79173